MLMYKVEIRIKYVTVCFLNRKKKQQMIKRRTKRQQQKGRKEPKAKRKLNKRMLKKKTTLKMEIPKLMRYFSSTKAGSRARCAGSTAAGALLGSRGWGGSLPHWEDRAAVVPAQGSSQGEPAGMAFSFQLLPALCWSPSTGAVCWPRVPLGAGSQQCPRFGEQWSPGRPSPSSPELTLHIPSGLLGSSAAQHGLVLGQNLVLSSTQFFKTILCLRTIQQEICKVNSVLSLICSLFSQVLAVAAPLLSCLLLGPGASSISC